jgi:hypothetical protein
MSLRKRLRVLKAALMQEWREVTCPVCGFMWFTQQVGSLWPNDVCAECEAKQFEQAVVTDYRLREWA